MCEKWLIIILLGAIIHPGERSVLALRKRCIVKCELYGCLEQLVKYHCSIVPSILSYWACAIYPSRRLSERKLRDLNCSHSPSLAIVTGRHFSSDTFTLCHGVDVVRVGSIQNNLGVGPRYGYISPAPNEGIQMSLCYRLTVSTNSSTIVFGALYRAAPALGFAVTCRQCRDGLSIDRDGLGVVPAVVIEFVCHNV